MHPLKSLNAFSLMIRMWSYSAALSRSLKLSRSLSLFRAAVPQAMTSLNAMEKRSVVTTWMQGSRQRAKGHKVFAAMVRIMALVVRWKHKVRLRRAAAISIGLDDRGAY